MAAFPLMVVATVPSMEMIRSATDELRFLIHKDHYDAVVAKAKLEGKHSIIVDDWSIFFNANSFVIWDEQDQPEKMISGFRSSQIFGNHYYLIVD